MKTRMEDELVLCDLNRAEGRAIDSALTQADKCGFVCSFSLCVLNTDQLQAARTLCLNSKKTRVYFTILYIYYN